MGKSILDVLVSWGALMNIVGSSRDERWPGILNKEIDKARDMPFEWGASDCALWVANVVEAMTGIDYAESFREKYTTKTGADRALQRYGLEQLAETVTGLLGAPIEARRARRGDVVMMPMDGIQSIGICLGRAVAFKSAEGLLFFKKSDCECAWRIV